jgi:hypothetical protein
MIAAHTVMVVAFLRAGCVDAAKEHQREADSGGEG